MAKRARFISQKVFAKVVNPHKHYLPSAVAKELKSAGLAFAGQRLTRLKTLKALRHLRNKKLLPQYSQPLDLLDQAAKLQFEQDEAEAWAEKEKHIKANILLDITQESPEAKVDVLNYDRIRNSSQRVIDQIEAERLSRERAIKTEQAERTKRLNRKAPDAPVIELAADRPLPDMDIG